MNMYLGLTLPVGVKKNYQQGSDLPEQQSAGGRGKKSACHDRQHGMKKMNWMQDCMIQNQSNRNHRLRMKEEKHAADQNIGAHSRERRRNQDHAADHNVGVHSGRKGRRN